MLSLSFAKLVATPTENQWSQVYNAGNFFASLSLSKNEENENVSLNSLGKDILSNLEAEFFTLEEKSLENIKQAILKSVQAVSDSASANLCAAFFKNDILYIFIAGSGKIILKRDDKIGTLLEKVSKESSEITSASGYLKNDDTIILQTHQFAKDMTPETISSALDLSLPNDIAEALSPGMHEKADGGQAAIIINYKEAAKPPLEDVSAFGNEEEIPPVDDEVEREERIDLRGELPSERFLEKEEQEEDVSEKEKSQKTPLFSSFKLSSFISSLKLPFLKNKNTLHLNHKKKLFLSIAIVIFVILTMSVLLTKQREENSKTTAQFVSIYKPALKDYDDGKSVQSINKIFARDEFLNARKRLVEGKDKFKKGSKEEKQISELLAKVEAEIGGNTGESVVKPKEVDIGKNDFLSVVKANNSGLGFTKDQNATYFVTDEAVVSVSNSGAKKDIIENSDDWESPVGLSTYQGNMYVLDQENGVLKFTVGASDFGKSSYFKTTPSNISSAQAIAIDGSVWILFRDGSIFKYTRGESDGFSAKGLDKPFSSPTKLFTNADTESIYILDRGNSRIVELNKDGNFQDQFVADILKNALDFEVSEKDGKILVLSGGKFYEFQL